MLKRITPPHIKILLIVIAFSVFFVKNAFATTTETEKEKAISIQSDSAEFDDRQGKAIYRGHAIMEQGTTRVTADTLILFRDPKGKIKSILALGEPAHFTQNGDTISGDSLAYDLETKILASAPAPGKHTTIFLSSKETITNEQSLGK